MIENIIGSKSKISIIRELFRSDAGQTIRQLALKSGTPYSVAYRDIELLKKEDFIKIKRNNSYKIISINKNHKMYKLILDLFSGENTDKKPKKLFKSKNGLIIIHHNADPDAVGSAIALARGFTQSNLRCEIFAPGGLSAQSKRLLEKYPYPILSKVNSYPSLIFILDTSSPEQLENIKIPARCKTIIIDHHAPGKLAETADMKIIDPSAHSTAVLVHDMLISAGINITSEIAFFLMAAIVADTGFLRLIDRRDITLIGKLMEKTDIEDIFAALSTRIPHEEKIMRITSMQHLEVYTIKDKIIAFSKVGSFESKIANFYVESFADIAIIENIHKNSARISARARKYLNEQVDLVPVFRKIGKDLKGNGGGHNLAASANGTASDKIQNARDRIKAYIESVFNEKLKPLGKSQ